ncbi:MAG TPA: Hsp20/alpha crystallin family protein [Deferrisomatales bacterium]|nr:Hsp20/alpha crystallin family protein [Deferrisomatales bacterium]
MAHDIEKTVQEPGTDVARSKDRELTRQQERYASPPVDIFEKEDALTVLADLPGVAAAGLSVHVEQGVLTIEGKVDAGASGDLLLQEFDLTSFYRQFRIAETIDTEKISAALHHGVLHLTLPKGEKAKPRQIPVVAS